MGNVGLQRTARNFANSRSIGAHEVILAEPLKTSTKQEARVIPVRRRTDAARLTLSVVPATAKETANV